MIPTQKLVQGFVDSQDRASGIQYRRQRLYVRAALVEIPEGRIVEVNYGRDDDRPTRRERVQGWLLVGSIVVLALFMAWMVVPQ